MIYDGGVFFSVKLTPDERNAGAFCYGFDLMIYGGDVFFSVKLDQMNGTPELFAMLCLGLNDLWRRCFFPSS
jgi:hypothetical protein